MDIFKRIEEKTLFAAKAIKFDSRYVPGVDEDLDMFCAYNESLSIYCYGETEAEALASAQNEAAHKLSEDSKLLYSILNDLKKETKV